MIQEKARKRGSRNSLRLRVLSAPSVLGWLFPGRNEIDMLLLVLFVESIGIPVARSAYREVPLTRIEASMNKERGAHGMLLFCEAARPPAS